MWKYWFCSILAIVTAWVLSAGVALSYAATSVYKPLALPPSWEDMPGVAERLYNAFYESPGATDYPAVPYAADFVQDDSLRYPIPQTPPNEDLPEDKSLYLKTNIVEEASYDPKTNEYVLTRKMGDVVLSRRHMTMDEYVKFTSQKAVRDYWKSKADYTPTTSSGLSGLIPGLNLDFLDEKLGKDLIKFDMNGSIGLEFALVGTRRDDPSLDIKHRRTFNFDFDADINVNLNATIADRLKFNISHNTEALFQFDNKFKLEYEGKEDEIVKNISAGNIDFPLNTTLISGVQELFGIKAKLQFGKTFITGVFSEQRSESTNVRVEGGAQSTEFELKVDEYEENRHFFLAQYFREHYHEALSELPLVNSRLKITKIEVWVTNIGSPVQNNRNIVAFTDLAESKPVTPGVRGYSFVRYPDQDRSNNLLTVFPKSSLRNLNTVGQYLQGRGLTNGKDFEKVESARRLDANEYSFNPALGFITLNQTLNSDQVLAVAFQYQIVGDTTVYQVGEFSDQGINDPQVLVVKLLKSSVLNTETPLWDLMMKNVYSLNTYQLSGENFRFNIMYSGNERGVPSGYFSDKECPVSGIPLIQVFGVDNLDTRQNRNPDGLFDYLDGAATGAGYIQSDKGLVYFPWPEPFGKDMVEMFGGDSVSAAKYRYDELYRKTKTEAQQYSEKNKYTFVGSYKSSGGSEISLGAYNLPEGSVKVMAGNTPLVENQDYTVNYSAGIVQIINPGVLASGVPIDIKTESRSNSLLTKRMMGLRVEHFFDEHFYVGATVMNLRQSTLTQKVNYGEEPISNTIYGFDASYDRESRWLTKAVDAILPFEDSKAPSRISLYGEFAHFLPGHSRAIGKSGTTYIDDFESSKSTINIKEPYSWYLASTPQKQNDLFPESQDQYSTTTVTGRNRAKLAWYTVDPIFYSSARPKNISKEDLSNHYTRRVLVNEVFPGRQLSSNEAQALTILNVAFYPSERGPYNYDARPVAGATAGANADGSLKNPETRWGGVMRKVNNTDFEAANVEYIEFWVMDPFIGTDGRDGNPRHSGGKLYFNLGDISEDVLRDGRKSFENGLPTSEVVENVDETQWGRVPTIQAIVNSFDNDPAARKYQDVGLDGLSSTDERSFFRDFLDEMGEIAGQNSETYRKIYEDPSSDNYMYFRRGVWDTVQHSANKIADRYKYYNNPDGNSPSNDDNPESYPTQQTNYPNTEDISEDNTLNEAENYYQYEVDLDPDKMEVGEGYITDVYEANVKLSNNNTAKVKWYQFKIPVNEPDKVVGQMQNLQSVRFVRMFMRGFKEPVILRFASLDLVRSDWRKYDNALVETGEAAPGGSNTTFEVATVNVEENGQRTPIRYVLPPGIERMLDPSDQNNVEMNEQSLSLKVTNLADGDARGIYRNTSYDMRQFKKMEMFVHMEKVNEMDNARDGDVHLFIRMGSDNQDNYYEYDIPLSYTEWGQSARDLVWPEANKVEIDLNALVKVKETRNRLMRESNSGSGYATVYSEQIGKATYSVRGTPSISAVKTILIGLRNPRQGRPNEEDDGRAKSVEVWINEFSLNEFKKEGGVAATARAQLALGDLGTISVAGAYTQANFGQLEQKLTDLSQSNTASYDIAVDLEMGRFLPEKAGIKLPVHYDLSSTISNPKYNPLDPDIKTKDDLKNYTSKQEKKEFKKAIQDYTIRQNVNLMNVRKERTNAEKQPQFWDIENFNISYAYSSTLHRDEDMEFDNQTIHRGGLGYDYSTASRFFTPLGKTKMASNPWAAILTDFNVNYIPNMFSFNMELEREYSESKMRNKNADWDILMPSTIYKRFDWSRNYNFRYDLTKSISINYSANANSYLREPPGRINNASRRDSVWRSFIQGGSMTNYDQNLGFTYTLPINKIPIFDWVEGSAAYNAVYRWEGGSIATQERLGNVITNSMDVSANGSVNLVGLYNKIPFLKKINDGNRRNRRGGRSNTIMSRANQKEEEPEVKSAWKTIYKGALRFLMMVRDANISYSRNEGTSLPGFMPEPDLFGVNFGKDAPGAGFALFGSQADIRRRAARNGWLSTDSLMTTPYYKQFTESVTAQVSVEPFVDFRITLNFGYSKVENKSSYYTYNSGLGDFRETNPLLNGSYNVTNVMIGTAFSKFDKKYFDKTYQKFLDNRIIIAERMAADNAIPGYNPHNRVYDTAARGYFPQGYMSNNQDVMIPALIAAYTGRDPHKVSLSAMDKFPLPNWSLTYSGLTKIKGVRKVFKNFSISHAYSSSYTVGSYTNNLLYKDAQDFVENIDAGGNFRSKYIMDGIVLSEQFSPLIKINMTFVNDLSLNFEYRQSRQIGLSFVNNQITEMRTKEWIIGAGYRIKNVGFKVNSGGAGKRRISSDIVLRADLSIRDNIRLLRKIDQQINTPSEGALITSINVYAEYEITRQISARVFYDMTLNKPYIANQFYNSNGRGGISLTYKFTQ
ncbi:MAG: cell surface protein SprA [Bacteroides sp.]|nr:cell surface protein SprA [Bacteroides sp.]MCM1085639.1 cell surface protein SprA [Bacteroides sp.]